MRNLLSDLVKLGKGGRASGHVDIELGLQGSAHPGLDGFLEEVSEIKKLLDTLTKLLKDLQNSNEESKVATKASAVKEIKMRMEKLVSEVTKVARLGKSKLQKMNEDNLANRGKQGFGEGSDVDRSRKQTTIGLTARLRDRILEFQTLREAIRKEYREVVERRIFIVTGERADEETIDRLIETGDSERLYQRAIQEQGHGRVLDTLQEIQERHDNKKEIETNLLELDQIFFDMSVLVEAQGEKVNDIEEPVGMNWLKVHQDMLRSEETNFRRQRSCGKTHGIGTAYINTIIILVVVLSLKPWAN